MTQVAPTRRERQRAATLAEIKDVARAHIAAVGAPALSLRAVARDLGMSAPALYRYYDSRDALLTDLLVDCYTSLAEALEAARDAQPEDDLAARFAAATLAYRSWGLEHRAEFGLVFGGPVPGYTAPADGPTHLAGSRFGAVFLALVVEAHARHGYPVPPDDELGPVMLAQLAGCRDKYALPADLPLGVLALWLQGWGHLHGLISLEVFGHLAWVAPDGAALFAMEVAALLTGLGLERPALLDPLLAEG